MSKASYDDVVNEVKRKRSTCAELVAMLEALGFSVRRGSSGNHHTFAHRSLAGFHGGNFDCGHGRDPVPKGPYFTRVLRILENYEDELRQLNK